MTYEYLCEACGHEWTTSQKITEDPVKTCPQCGEEKAKRLISGRAGILFKGTGWFNSGGY